ncbi:hypothetical protein BJ878DRAFT_478576 [Calycina marina]|uniref:Uncharacterized protein n=1 Tax=Calycina marina TaxID=1763456 RepID=A0A9P7Z6A5_9HELO|nr:hypothetical protein BJ878DRAFT_478576 [Calycina marina]
MSETVDILEDEEIAEGPAPAPALDHANRSPPITWSNSNFDLPKKPSAAVLEMNKRRFEFDLHRTAESSNPFVLKPHSWLPDHRWACGHAVNTVDSTDSVSIVEDKFPEAELFNDYSYLHRASSVRSIAPKYPEDTATDASKKPNTPPPKAVKFVPHQDFKLEYANHGPMHEASLDRLMDDLYEGPLMSGRRIQDQQKGDN